MDQQRSPVALESMCVLQRTPGELQPTAIDVASRAVSFVCCDKCRNRIDSQLQFAPSLREARLAFPQSRLCSLQLFVGRGKIGGPLCHTSIELSCGPLLLALKARLLQAHDRAIGRDAEDKSFGLNRK